MPSPHGTLGAPPPSPGGSSISGSVASITSLSLSPSLTPPPPPPPPPLPLTTLAMSSSPSVSSTDCSPAASFRRPAYIRGPSSSSSSSSSSWRDRPRKSFTADSAMIASALDRLERGGIHPPPATLPSLGP
eukprot:CAMPEP_0113571304 /NCGR_PEP_ID=MMETSP0015_2-20120614/25480_1 /TAXON_ID=2838 /ORGANISM="Odontella" /LENGTH=130 /DNA_ID=CAMNT_0000474241 /DNA_START=19 /DNA_END=411 /DNA_ORIENTATION=- /assembly_acc=CAM_ASM_000160